MWENANEIQASMPHFKAKKQIKLNNQSIDTISKAR